MHPIDSSITYQSNMSIYHLSIIYSPSIYTYISLSPSTISMPYSTPTVLSGPRLWGKKSEANVDAWREGVDLFSPPRPGSGAELLGLNMPLCCSKDGWNGVLDSYISGDVIVTLVLVLLSQNRNLNRNLPSLGIASPGRWLGGRKGRGLGLISSYSGGWAKVILLSRPDFFGGYLLFFVWFLQRRVPR